MKLGIKGEGGFTESILAMMVVIISLTAFLSFLAFSLPDEMENDPEIPLDVLSDVRIIKGNIEADIEEKMREAIERYGFRGMRINLSVHVIYESQLTMSAGSFDSDVILSKSGTLIAGSDDGRSVPVRWSMAVWP